MERKRGRVRQHSNTKACQQSKGRLQAAEERKITDTLTLCHQSLLIADSKGGSREFHPPPPHSTIRPVSIYTTCLIPKFFQRQDGILLFNLKYLKLTYFDIFLGFLWLSIMKKKKKDKKIIRITTGTLNQKFLDLPLCSAHQPTKTSSHSQIRGIMEVKCHTQKWT